MIKTQDFNAIIEWVLANYSYGHLDEMPDCYLITMLKEPELSYHFACLFFQASRTKSDDVEELLVAHDDATVFDIISSKLRVRGWAILERMRRLGKVQFSHDVLIKEMASLDAGGCVLKPNGEPFTLSIVEVQPGVINIVGEEIDLCKEKKEEQ